MTKDKRLLNEGNGSIDKTSPSAKFVVLDPKDGVTGATIANLWLAQMQAQLDKEQAIFDEVRAHK